MLAHVLTGSVHAMLLALIVLSGRLINVLCLFMLMQHPPAPYGGYTNGQYYGGYAAGPYVSLHVCSRLHAAYAHTWYMTALGSFSCVTCRHNDARPTWQCATQMPPIYRNLEQMSTGSIKVSTPPAHPAARAFSETLIMIIQQ
jgi:hypothetical protein